ncbi:MAG: SLOG family protein [Candidatus Thorarchaeota archaeon]|jgi:hypothetical protein
MHRVIVCGGRRWNDTKPIKRELSQRKLKYGLELIMVCGLCPGKEEDESADMLAWRIARSLGIDRAGFPANWIGRKGKSGGPVRNIIMLQLIKPHEVLAFHKNIEESRGTKHMLKIAEAAGVEVHLFKE